MIRVAIVGAGIGAEHLAGYRALPERFHVASMCDLDGARARAATGDDPSIAISSDLDALLTNQGIDLIDVCLPPHLHVPVSIRALEAGKHVICEKPLARSLEEVDRIETAVEASGRSVFPVFQYRYGIGVAQVQALKAAGLAGRSYVASLETHWNREAGYYAAPWRGTWAGEAGGALLGHAIHAHDLLCHLLGPVAEVFAISGTRVNPIETEDCAALSFRMESGALASSSVTLGAATDSSRIRVCFEGFTAESGAVPYAPASVPWRITPRGADKAAIDAVLAGIPAVADGFGGYLGAVADALGGRGGGEVTLADGRRSIELVSAIYASAQTGQPMTLPLGPAADAYKGWHAART